MVMKNGLRGQRERCEIILDARSKNEERHKGVARKVQMVKAKY